MTFDTIDDILTDIAAGKMVVITDDEDRENEGDLVMAAEKVTPEAINFMATHGRGLICAPLTEERARVLGLQSMVPKNREMFKTDFTVSVDAAEGVTTGISAPDRARTILALADDNCTADDLVQPGHIFPLQAREGGVLRRAGHTEASVDLARLAGLRPAGVICEILRKDGTMARLPDLAKFCKRHKLRMGTIRDLIAWRRVRERLVRREQTINLPTIYGTFKLHLYRATHSEEYHLALTLGAVGSDGTPELVRVHSECLTGDVFGSLRCDCGPQLHDALQQIGAEGRGVLLYMRQEGRGIGLPAKIAAYKLQEEGLDTVEANARLGFPMDLRDYGFGAQMLADLGLKNIRLMTNNPKKIVGLEGYGLTVTEQVPIRPPAAANPHNERYLETKREKMGHLL